MKGSQQDLFFKDIEQIIGNIRNRFHKMEGEFLPENWESRLNEIRRPEYDISIIGHIKAGKSTMLNALIFGDWVLPTQVNVCTAALATIKKGKEDIALINYTPIDEINKVLAEIRALITQDNGTVAHVTKEILKKELDLITQAYKNYDHLTEQTTYPLDQLENCLAAEKMSGEKILRSRLVNNAEISVQNVLVQDNIRFIDTPGLHDPLRSRVMVTVSKIRKSDCVILLIPPKGIDQNTLDFLRDILPKCPAGKIFVILSKVDMLAKQELIFEAAKIETIILKQVRDLQQTLRTILRDVKENLKEIRVIPIAAKLALKDEKKNTPPEYAYASNLDRVREHLLHFLENTKGLESCYQSYERVMAILRETERNLELKMGRYEKELEMFDASIKEIEEKLERLKSKESKIAAQSENFNRNYEINRKRWSENFFEVKKRLTNQALSRLRHAQKTGENKIKDISLIKRVSKYKQEVEKVFNFLKYQVEKEIFWETEDNLRIELEEVYQKTREEKDRILKKHMENMKSEYQDIFSQINPHDQSIFRKTAIDARAQFQFEAFVRQEKNTYGLIRMFLSKINEGLPMDGTHIIKSYTKNVEEYVKKEIENVCENFANECFELYDSSQNKVLTLLRNELEKHRSLLLKVKKEITDTEEQKKKRLQVIENQKNKLLKDLERNNSDIENLINAKKKLPESKSPLYQELESDVQRMVDAFEDIEQKTQACDY